MLLVRRASEFVAYGIKAKEYLVSLGAKEEKIEIAINTVDTQFYANESKRYRRETELKKGHLLYIGHLSPRKNVMKVLKVLKVLSQKRADIILDIVGDGDDRERLERYVKENMTHNDFDWFLRKKGENPSEYDDPIDLFAAYADIKDVDERVHQTKLKLAEKAIREGCYGVSNIDLAGLGIQASGIVKKVEE